MRAQHNLSTSRKYETRDSCCFPARVCRLVHHRTEAGTYGLSEDEDIAMNLAWEILEMITKVIPDILQQLQQLLIVETGGSDHSRCCAVCYAAPSLRRAKFPQSSLNTHHSSNRLYHQKICLNFSILHSNRRGLFAWPGLLYSFLHLFDFKLIQRSS